MGLFTYYEENKEIIKNGETYVKNGKGFLIGKIVLHSFIVLAFLVIILKSFTIVPPGNVKVLTLFGKVQEKSLVSGFHFKNPLTSTTKMSVQTQEYTMSIAHSEGEKVGDDSITSLTNDGLSVNLDITVLYRLNGDDAPKVYNDIGLGYVDKIIRPSIRTVIRDVASSVTFKELYSEKREEVALTIEKRLSENVNSRGVIVENVLLRNVDPPKSVKDSIEQKISAEQDVQKAQFTVEQEKLEAERKEVEAQGIRKAQDIISLTLTPSYLEYYKINMMKNLAESDNTTFLFVPIDESGSPIINIGK